MIVTADRLLRKNDVPVPCQLELYKPDIRRIYGTVRSCAPSRWTVHGRTGRSLDVGVPSGWWQADVGSISSTSVNASKKILLAAVIVAAGYGAATFCGRPNAASLPPHASPADSSRLQQQATGGVPLATSVLPAPTLLSNARLVPDGSDDSAEQTTNSKPPSVLPLTNTGNIASVPQTTDFPLAESPPPFHAVSSGEHFQAEPRARLRDEAPRPLGFTAPPDATVSRITPLAAPPRAPDTTPINFGRAEKSVDSSIGESQPLGSLSAAQTATWNAPLTGERLTPIPIRPSTEPEEPRTHIVVDGDSLAKLAGRYLDDPHRADEIYQLNRELLSDPELLPIGVELTMPARTSRASEHSLSPQSNLPRAVAIHSPQRNGLIPVRPIPETTTLTPRARLINPRLAE
jgi:nucleoid-associated protein YgaU